MPVSGKQGSDALTWSMYRAILRISSWETCMGKPELNLSEVIRRERNTKLPEKMQYFENAAKYLLATSKASQSDLHDPDSATYFLKELFERLEETKKRYDKLALPDLQDYLSHLTRTMYHWQYKDVQVFVAAMGLFDVLIDDLCVSSKHKYHVYRDSVELWEDTFERITYGFNLWAIRRRLRDLFCGFMHPDEVKELRIQLDNEGPGRILAANQVKEAIAQFKNFEGRVSCEYYERSIAGIYWSKIPRNEIVRAVFLEVTCEDIHKSDCFLLEGLVEQLGMVQHRWIRKSFYFPQPNGAYRFQTAVRSDLSGNGLSRLLVFRIGTPTIQHYNEWGRLLEWADISSLGISKTQAQKLSNVITDTQRRKKIYVYKQTGERVWLPLGSSVADFMNIVYPDTYRYLYRLTVNRIPSKLDRPLKEGDVVNARIDRTEQSTLSPRYLPDHVSHPVIQQILEENRNALLGAAEYGRERILQLVQGYLKYWGYTISIEEIFTLLKMLGYARNGDHPDDVFSRMARRDDDYLRRDDDLCQLALQYQLRGRIEAEDGSPLPLTWRNIYIAGCCHPKFGDDIVGNHDPGPRNPVHQHLRESMLRIHKADCPQKPDRANDLRLRWVDGQWGIILNIQYEDFSGSLGAILDEVYNQTLLRLQYIIADGINYHPQALVTLYAYATTERQREDAVRYFKSRFEVNRSGSVTALMMDPRETNLMVKGINSNPFLRGETETRMGDEVPMNIIEREQFPLFHRNIRNHLPYFIVEGLFRTGKTTMLRFMRRSIQNSQIVTVYLSLREHTLTQEKDLTRSICAATENAIEARSDLGNIRPPSYARNVDELASWFQKLSKKTGRRYVVMIDEFSALNDALHADGSHFGVNFCNRLRSALERMDGVTFVLVFQAAVTKKLITTNANFHDLFVELCKIPPIKIGSLNRDENYRYLLPPFKKEEIEITDEAVETIYRMSGGFIAITQQVASVVLDYAQRHALKQVTSIIVDKAITDHLQHDRRHFEFQLQRVIRGFDTHALQFLKTIANAEEDKDQNWVQESEIITKSHLNDLLAHQYLQSMEDANLIEFDLNTSYRIRGALLKKYLCTRPILKGREE